MPYHSPYSGNRYNSGDRNHGGDWNHHGDRWHDHDWDHHHHGFYGVYGWVGSPYWPWWGWGYPYLPAYWDSWNDYDNQPGANYGAALYPEYSPAPYEEPAPDQPDSTPWPYSSPAPPASQPSPAVPAAPEAPVTLVFKDRRPNQQIRNYLLTAKTLSVLDQQRRDIPVDQIDLAATARLNREAGVEFEVPSGGR